MVKKVALIPVGLHGRDGLVEAAIISGDAPLLLSRSTMKSLEPVMDFSNETLSIMGGSPRAMTTNEAGQYVIDVMQFAPKEVLVAAPCVSKASVGKISMKANRSLMASQEAWRCRKSNRDQCVIAELFSPRFSTVVEQMGGRGLAFDILQGLDLLNPKVQRAVDRQLEAERPDLLVACPPCKHWGGWYHMNQHHISAFCKGCAISYRPRNRPISSLYR